MSYTISNGTISVTFGNTGGTTPTITSLSSRRYSQADVASWFGNPIDQNIFVDADGVVQTYSLEGTYANTIANINTFISNVDSMLSGKQLLVPCTFTSGTTDVPSNRNMPCVLTSFEYEWTDESMNSIKWAIELTIAKAPS